MQVSKPKHTWPSQAQGRWSSSADEWGFSFFFPSSSVLQEEIKVFPRFSELLLFHHHRKAVELLVLLGPLLCCYWGHHPKQL